MKIDMIKKLFESYLLTCDLSEVEEVRNSIKECNELMTHYNDNDVWDNEVHLITPYTLGNFLNITTYDDFGKRKKQLSKLNREDYYDIVRNKLDLGGLTNNSLDVGYDIINDLWHDNEKEGYNNDDGTFK